MIFLIDTEANRTISAIFEKEQLENNDTESISVKNIISEIENEIGQNVQSMCFKIVSKFLFILIQIKIDKNMIFLSRFRRKSTNFGNVLQRTF